jgi:methyltransferase (TIGR00027 family)
VHGVFGRNVCVTDERGVGMPGVVQTAVWMAGMRVGEGGRADRLFDDPLAEAFVSAAAAGRGGADGAAALPAGAADFLALRTRFFDDRARQAGAAGIRQLVLLAAGLDSRAFRLDWPAGLRLFELDLPPLFAFKEPVLAATGAVARCERVVVAVDLRTDWPAALLGAGFDPAAPTAWLAEGLLPYLSDDEGDRLAAAVSRLSVPGSQLTFDHLDGTAADRPAMRATAEAIRSTGARLVSTMADPAQRLARQGWQATVSRRPDVAEQYGRPLPADADTVAANASIWVHATR